MYRGFNLTGVDWNNAQNIISGQKIFNGHQKEIKATLEEYLNNNGSLDGTKIQNEWFPNVEADIFISHSHRSVDTALSLAGWLWEKFRLKAFIDSAVWGYADELLKLIDDKYCLHDEPGFGKYSYEARNFSTSHVHMMLSVALMKMIDKTECIIFLNNSDSLTLENSVKTQTNSPWIYSEIAVTQLIQTTIPTRIKEQKLKMMSKGGEVIAMKEHLKIEHEVDLRHLTNLTVNDLHVWEILALGEKGEGALDSLYEYKPAKSLITL